VSGRSEPEQHLDRSLGTGSNEVCKDIWLAEGQRSALVTLKLVIGIPGPLTRPTVTSTPNEHVGLWDTIRKRVAISKFSG